MVNCGGEELLEEDLLALTAVVKGERYAISLQQVISVTLSSFLASWGRGR